MKLRNRRKNDDKPIGLVDEHEEDVDDPDEPEDDSDCDPEWEIPAEGDAPGIGKKRKAFSTMPEQMRSERSKIQSSEEDGEDDTDEGAEPLGGKKRKTFTPIKPIKTEPESPKKNLTNVQIKTEKVDPDPSTINIKAEFEQIQPVRRGRKPKYLTSGSSTANSISSTNLSNTNTSTSSGSRIISSKNGSLSEIIPKTMTISTVDGAYKTCSYKVVKVDTPIIHNRQSAHSSSGGNPSNPGFRNGDFVMDLMKKNGDCIWQVDGMNLLQKFVPHIDKDTNEKLYKSSYSYDGLNTLNSSKYQKITVTNVRRIKNIVFVKVFEDFDPLSVEIKKEPISDEQVSSSAPLEPPPPVSEPKPAPRPKPSNEEVYKDFKEQYKDEFTVFLQALISQCLDNSFLPTVYSDNDSYFIDKIKVIDDILETRKFSLMTLTYFPQSDRMLYALHSCPNMEEKPLSSIKLENYNCVVCAANLSSVCLELSGDAYDKNSLCTINLLDKVDEDLKLLNVCKSCSKMLKLYNKMCHTKYLIYKQCEISVQRILDSQKDNVDASEVIFSLLNNEPWCETRIVQCIRDWLAVDELKKEAQA